MTGIVKRAHRPFRRAVVIAAAAALLVLATGCNTPQIPLPPPLVEDLTFSLADETAGTIVVGGDPNDRTRNAIVHVLNQRTGYGVIAPAGTDGAFEARPLKVEEGDELTVDYRRGFDLSDPLCIVASFSASKPAECP